MSKKRANPEIADDILEQSDASMQDVALEAGDAPTQEDAPEAESSEEDLTRDGASDHRLPATGRRERRPSLMQRLRASMSSSDVSEGDDALTGKKHLSDIMRSDVLQRLVKNNIWLISLVTVFLVLYVAVGYQCQQDTIVINRLSSQVEDAKLRALSSMSDLTELSRQSVLERLMEQNDGNVLDASMPPIIINVPE